MASLRVLLFAGLAFPFALPAATCLVVASPLTFGSYDVFSPTPRDAVSTIVVECTTAINEPTAVGYAIRLADTGGVRALHSAEAMLGYQLYADSMRSQIWGDGAVYGAGVNGSLQATAPLVATVRTHYVYGRLPARQLVAPGQYAATVVVTIDY